MKLLFPFHPLIRSSRASYIILQLLVVSLLIIGPYRLSAQSRKELEHERKHILEEIKQTKQQLKEVSARQRETISYLSLLQRQISYRESLIQNLQDELGIINQGITESSDIVSALENDLDALRQEYARLVYYYYKNRGQYSMLSYIFSSNSFHEAYSRMKLMHFYADYRTRQMELIVKTQHSLIEKMTDLRKKQLEKQLVLTDLDKEKKELEGDKQDQQQLVRNLKQQGTQLQKDLQEKEVAAQKLERAIRDAIAREIALARQRERERIRAERRNARKKNVPDKEDNEIPLSPEAKLLSDKFAANKGHLPWPVERGAICERFGRQPHPTLPGIYVNNNGSKICTGPNAMARSIFEGEVRAILPIDAQRKFVLIKHGDFFTVYSNLKIVLVKLGQKVSTRQEIGIIAKDAEDNKTELELQIWRGGNTKLNPENWIAK